MSDTDLRTTIMAYLASHNVVTLATQGPEGPWASAVFFVSDDVNLYFLSAPTTRHCRNLEADPRAAATVQEDYSAWKNIKGVQMEGRVTRLGGIDSAHAASLYARKFAFADPARAGAAIAAALAKISWYKLEPAAVYFIDNSLGLGHRAQLDLSAK
ncbi:MAG: pyridoxamine 5'-phosphate oxidase family protein [Telluria sp.]|nr:pyridoxamine 5'-phosphate oxidase family protein [Telluria sp.]